MTPHSWQLSPSLSKALGIQYHLNCTWRLQSLGMVEKTTDLIKRHLRKPSQETHLPWITLLPMALLPVRNTHSKLGLSPSEMIFSHQWFPARPRNLWLYQICNFFDSYPAATETTLRGLNPWTRPSSIQPRGLSTGRGSSFSFSISRPKLEGTLQWTSFYSSSREGHWNRFLNLLYLSKDLRNRRN